MTITSTTINLDRGTIEILACALEIEAETYTGRHVPKADVSQLAIYRAAQILRQLEEGQEYNYLLEAAHIRAAEARLEEEIQTKPPRQCLIILEDQYTENGYIPSLVEEGVSGHIPLTGRGGFSQPWYFGRTIEEAKEMARQANAERGLSDEDVMEIRASSIRASINLL